MKKIFLITFILLSCNQGDGEVQVIDEIDNPITIFEEVSTTRVSIEEVEVKQLESFSNILFEVDTERSTARYLAPKVFLNTNEEIVVGETTNISGNFQLSIGECDSSDSCVLIKNLKISANLLSLQSGNGIRDNSIKSKWLESHLYPIATYSIDELILSNKNFDSKIDETVIGFLHIREASYVVPFSISAYMENNLIYVYGISQIETIWFGFDPPSKFGAWDVLNPIGIEIEIVARR